MKTDIHPKYKELKVIIGKDEFFTKSTYPEKEYYMDIDYRKHRAWTGHGSSVMETSNRRVMDFNDKFGNLNFGIKKS